MRQPHAKAGGLIDGYQDGFSKPIVTEIEPAATFWRAEEYQQCTSTSATPRAGLLSALLGR